MVAPAFAFAISRAAEILGEDEQLLWDLARLSQLKQKNLEDHGGTPKSLHYRAGAAARTIWLPAVIRGRG